MFSNWRSKISFKTVLLLGLFGVLFTGLGYYFGFVALPDIVDNKIWETKVLKNGTEQWDMFMKVPFPFTLKVHLFNIKNPDAVLQGEKPVVEDVGPFIYKIYKWKNDVSWESSNIISYYNYQIYHFDKDSSGERTEEDVVTVLNSPFMSMLYKVEELQPQMVSMLEPALPHIFGENNGPFMKVKVGDYLFRGIKICEDGGHGRGMLAEMACKQIAYKVKEAKNMRIENRTVFFANLHYKNNTHLGRFTIKSGAEKRQEAGQLVKYNGKSYIKAWEGENSTCNRIRGVTTIFPTRINEHMSFEAFSEDICRSMAISYQKEEKVRGIKGYRFSVNNDSLDYFQSENRCFCTNRTNNASPETGCMKNGLMDLSTCTGGPVMLSFPHMLYGDQKYLDGVDGLKPNQSEHETFVVLEPISGTPLKLAQRVQFNMFIRPIEGVSVLENVTETLVPLLWVEESTVLEDDYVQRLKSDLFRTFKIANIIRWIVVTSGVTCIILSLSLYTYKKYA